MPETDWQRVERHLSYSVLDASTLLPGSFRAQMMTSGRTVGLHFRGMGAYSIKIMILDASFQRASNPSANQPQKTIGIGNEYKACTPSPT